VAGVTADDLRRVPTLSDLSEEELEWLASRCTLVELQPGDVLVRPGDPPVWMQIILEGELHMIPEPQAKDAGRFYILRAGAITGMLPFSRMKRIPRLATAGTFMRIAAYPASEFAELLERIPALEPRLIAILTDRVKETILTEQQSEKLASLGRLSAGLAHELNNPAAAAQRAVAALRITIEEAEASTARLTEAVGLALVQQLASQRADLAARPPRHLSTIERSDHEELLAGALEEWGVQEPWNMAPTMVEGGVDGEWLSEFLEPVPEGARCTAIECLDVHLRASEHLRNVEEAARRISRLVADFKQYTYRGRAPLQELDVHEGIDSTIRILSAKLEGIQIRKEYAPDLPRITAYGAELTQVWTNILDNAADALEGVGEIIIRTWRTGESITVEFLDSGPGIPTDVIERVFDPFFTTKGVGSGTGLGLDIARRIVEEQHRGHIRVDSHPGATSFRIELPINWAGETLANAISAGVPQGEEV
jgi:signal transduction histidine kinase